VLAFVFSGYQSPPNQDRLAMLNDCILDPEARIFEIVHGLLRERAIERSFTVDDNLRDIGLTSLDMTNLVLSVEGQLAVRIPDNAITPANFTCVAAITGLVAKLLNARTDSPPAD
jgi:acyl carrier protein